MKRSKLSRLGLLFAAVLTLGVLVFAAACDDDEDDGDGGEETPAATENGAPDGDAEAQAVEAAVTAAIAAWNAGDVEGFAAAVTDAFLEEQFGVTAESAPEALPGIMAETPITIGEFSATEVSGTSATTNTPFFFVDGGLGIVQDLSLVSEGDAWLLDSMEPTTGDAGDATLVDVSLLEYAFDFDASQITDGNIALNATNIGGEEHEIALISVAADADLEQVASDVLTADAPPEGFVGVAFGFTPGSEGTVVLSEELAPGRYGMFCFLENAEGTPHTELGMINEFTIE